MPVFPVKNAPESFASLEESVQEAGEKVRALVQASGQQAATERAELELLEELLLGDGAVAGGAAKRVSTEVQEAASQADSLAAFLAAAGPKTLAVLLALQRFAQAATAPEHFAIEDDEDL